MRIEILVLAALAAFASAAPQWPYRDAVAPYYYGYPGKTPYMYRSGDEDDEMDESYLARQDLKVAPSKDAAAGSSVTVVEDDEKADGVRVVETGSAKPVAQIGSNNNRQTQQQQQEQAAAGSPSAAQAQQPQPLSTNNNAAAQAANNGQPLTVQQPGQQPPAFPPARPTARPRPPTEEDEDEEDEEDSEEDDNEDAEDEEDGDDDDEEEEDEEDEEDRKRNDNVAPSSTSESEEPQQISQQEQAQSSIVNNNSEGSDELVQEEQQPVVIQPVQQQQPQSQSAVLNNKVSKNKQKNANANVAPVVPSNVGGKPKRVQPAAVAIGQNKNNKNPGAIEALVPGYVTDQGEVLVPVDTVTGSQPITIVPDPFSPPSRIVSGPRPIPQSAVPSTPSRQVPYWYRSSPAISPFQQDPSPPRQTFYSSVPPPGSVFTFDDDDDDEDTPQVIPGSRLRQEEEDDGDDDEQDEGSEEEDEEKVKPVPQKVPLAAVPAVGNSGEDDEAEALAFVNGGGRPVANKRPTGTAASGNKKPAAGTQTPGSNESESEEDVESEEDDISQEEEEEDDSARAQVVHVNPKGRMYVDEDYVSFPPSRSPTLFAVIQGGFPGQGGPHQRRRQPQPQQVFSSPSSNNPYERYVVRVTPANRQPRPPTQQPLYYRPQQSSPPRRKVVPIASFDVSVEDTRPSSGPEPVAYYPGSDSEEEGESVIAPGGRPTPVTSYPFVYKVQGSLQGLRLPSHHGGSRPQGIRPPRPSASSFGYYGASFSGGPPGFGPSGGPSRPPRPSGYGQGPYSSPYASLAAALYGPYGPGGPGAFSGPNGPRRPPSGGPPVIVRRKQPGGGRPPKPQFLAVYNPTGSSSSGPGERPSRPRPREPVEEEYYTFEVPETNHKLVPGRPPSNNKRPTVHRKPTPVIHQKQVQEDEEESDEVGPPSGPPSPQHTIQIIPQGTVRRRSKQLKPKKKSKKTSSKKYQQQQQQQDEQDPLGLLSKINKSTKSKLH